jgi:hypothetical protein
MLRYSLLSKRRKPLASRVFRPATGFHLETTTMTQKATAAEGTTPVLTKQVTDLSVGDMILPPGFDGPRTIRRATKVTKGPQKGKFELNLTEANGQVDIADFAPKENVTVVGHEDGKKKAGAFFFLACGPKLGPDHATGANMSDPWPDAETQCLLASKAERACPTPPWEAVAASPVGCYGEFVVADLGCISISKIDSFGMVYSVLSMLMQTQPAFTRANLPAS